MNAIAPTTFVHRSELLPRPAMPTQVRGSAATLLTLRRNPLELWGPIAYREGILQGRFLGRSQFLLNDPDAIHQVLQDG